MENFKPKKLLGFWDIFFICVGHIIGAGVIALTGVAIGMTGPSVFLAYILAAVLIIIASFLIMIAGAALPVIGAHYVWSSRLLNGWAGSTVLILIVIANFTISLFGSAFGLYINPLFPSLSINEWGVFIITVIFISNLFGLSVAAKLQKVLVVIMIAAISIYAGFAMPTVRLEILSPLFPMGMMGFVSAVFLLKFATGGATLIVGLGGETRDPGKTIPLAIMTSTLVVGVVYSIIAFVTVAAVPWQGLVDQPLTVAGKEFLPGWAMAYFLVGGAGVAITTTLNGQFIQLPRNFMAASWDKLIPVWVASLNRFGSPYFILSVMYFAGVLPLALGLDISTIARVATITASLPAIAVYVAIWRLPGKFPDAYRNSTFPVNRFWLSALVVFAELSSLVGVAVLASGLSSWLVAVLLGAIAVAIIYYPVRRWYLRGLGFDLDAACTDPAIFTASSEHQKS